MDMFFRLGTPAPLPWPCKRCSVWWSCAIGPCSRRAKTLSPSWNEKSVVTPRRRLCWNSARSLGKKRWTFGHATMPCAKFPSTPPTNSRYEVNCKARWKAKSFESSDENFTFGVFDCFSCPFTSRRQRKKISATFWWWRERRNGFWTGARRF